MQQEVNRGTLIAAVVGAVVIFGGLSWYFFAGRPMPSRGSPQQISQPPGGGGYAGAFQRSHPPR